MYNYAVYTFYLYSIISTYSTISTISTYSTISTVSTYSAISAVSTFYNVARLDRSSISCSASQMPLLYINPCFSPQFTDTVLNSSTERTKRLAQLIKKLLIVPTKRLIVFISKCYNLFKIIFVVNLV